MIPPTKNTHGPTKRPDAGRDGERAARAEATTKAAIMAKAQDPTVRKAARQAARAMAILGDHNLKVNDWTAGGREGIAVEIKDTCTGEKFWITRRD